MQSPLTFAHLARQHAATSPRARCSEAMTRRAAARPARKRGDKRGVALVMTLGAITVLTVFLTELQETDGSSSSPRRSPSATRSAPSTTPGAR